MSFPLHFPHTCSRRFLQRQIASYLVQQRALMPRTLVLTATWTAAASPADSNGHSNTDSNLNVVSNTAEAGPGPSSQAAAAASALMGTAEVRSGESWVLGSTSTYDVWGAAWGLGCCCVTAHGHCRGEDWGGLGAGERERLQRAGRQGVRSSVWTGLPLKSAHKHALHVLLLQISFDPITRAKYLTLNPPGTAAYLSNM